MYKNVFFLFVLALIISSCSSVLHPWAFYNTIPMYGNIEKPANLIEVDKKFITAQTKEFHTADSASYIYNLIAWDYLHKGEIKTAIRRFNQAWLLDSTNASPYFGFSAYSELTGTGNANKYFKIGVSKDKNRDSEEFYFLNMAIFYQNTRKLNNSLSMYSKVLEINPNDTLSLRQRGYLYSIQENWEKAQQDLNNAIKLGIKDKHAYDKLGYTYEVSGNAEEALRIFEKSIELDANSLYPLYHCSLMHLKLGNFDAALKYIDKCLNIKSEHEEFIKTKEEILLSIDKK